MRQALPLRRLLWALALLPASLWADGVIVDKVYHPYVDALEYELEFRSVLQAPQPGGPNTSHWHQLSLGHAIGDDVFLEVYTIGAKQRGGGMDTRAWEAELKWQLTEQGEYATDWGLFMEYENELARSAHEFTVGLLAEREFGRWSGAANLFVVNEWGRDVQEEFETALALQARYRRSQFVEPGVEFYAGQDNYSVGPTLQGDIRLRPRQSLHWEAGALFGLTKASPDNSLRLLLEYEF
jgi:hypothetical protein